MPEHLSYTQSTLAPAGANAVLIDELATVLYVGAAVVFVLVMILAIYAAWRGFPRVSTTRWVVGGGIVFPAVVLTALLVYALLVGNALSVEAPDSALTIRITGKRWWWELRYPHPSASGALVTSANELHLPAGRTVRLLLDTDDVIRSFWVPSLSGKIDMIPGRVNVLVLRADKAGVYRAQCAEYCGTQHALMALYVRVHEEGGYEKWIRSETLEGREANDDAARRGKALFATKGCASCHTIRGTPAVGRLGPDLTHVASRMSLGAGILDNNAGTLAGWIANSQALKPGNLMPPIRLPPEDLHALTAYVASLK